VDRASAARPMGMPIGLPVLAVWVLGLVGIAAVVAGALIANAGIYVAALAVGLLVFYLILRHPPAVAYVALGWIMFEKSLGAHDPGLSNTVSLLGDVLLVGALYWVVTVNLLRRRSPVLRFGAIGVGLFAFTAFSIASTLLNGVPLHVAELGILDTLRSLIMFLVVINIGLSAKDVYRFVYWVIGIMSVSAFVGVLQAYRHSPAWKLGGLRLSGPHGLMRVDGLFDHPLSLGDYLALTLPLGLMLVVFGGVSGKPRRWLMAGTLVMVLALVLTFAREAWLAVPAAVLFVGLTVDRKVFKVALPPVLIAALFALPFLSSVNTNDTGQQRLTLFQLTWPLIKTHLLLGVGPGRFGGHVAAVTNTPLYAEYHVANYFYGTGNQIDQFWTHLLAESGVLGVAAFVSMIVACFLTGRRAYLATDDPRAKSILLGLLCAAPAAVILSFASSVLEEGPAATLFWCLMGMLTVLSVTTGRVVSPAPVVADKELGSPAGVVRRRQLTESRARP
jgi:O-antigen ligase